MYKCSASSVPTAADRARLKKRMDSPVSRSDSSSEPCEGSDCNLMAPLPLSFVYTAPPLVGPASSVGEDELAEWRSRYSLPSSIILWSPTPEERASSYIPGGIAVYEAFFDSGLRGFFKDNSTPGGHLSNLQSSERRNKLCKRSSIQKSLFQRKSRKATRR
ncbi:hypothetical protein IGI04_030349 [Brassica rapa subsp. trilocularis]|uniref:Uncharacterized protein n=1 Tax=Brassica rapa subsp. trilocularis TaxID=1813537 RepID=A0ABQ7LQG4_BRACM|nr:hypothetical protein IGI04_030349 [Brassica rapa subsp. trilocularis]